MNWKTQPLRKVASFDRTSLSPEQIQTGTQYIGLEHISNDGNIVDSQRVNNGDLASSKFTFDKRHILYGKLRPYLKKIARPEFSGICSTDIIPILVKSDLDRDFLYHYLRLPEMIDLATTRSTGVNLPRISPKIMAEFEIPLPPLAEQKRIAEVLDKADALRRKRRLALQKLDTLLQSVFLEMFGDPVKNPMGWETLTFQQIVQGKSGLKRGPFGGAIKKEIFVDKGYKIYEQKNAIYNDFNLGDYYIDEEKYKELKTFEVRPNDLIVSCSGTIGKVAIIPLNAEKGIINQTLLRIRTKKEIVGEIFVKNLLETSQMQRELFGGSSGSAIKNVKPLNEIRLTKIPVPPIKLQKEYYEFVIKFEEFKNKKLKAFEKTENLFQSLQQKAFKGELFEKDGREEIEEASAG